MSTVASDTTSSSDEDGSINLEIDSDLLYAYYDEYGNLVNENGYLLDEDGNLVVSADATLTAAYSIEDDNGNVYVVSDTASVVNGMILSAVDSSKGEDTVDVYGNSVDSSGYLIDQADSEGGLLTLSAASDLTITEVQSATVTDADGNEVTVTDGTAGFMETEEDSGVYYVIVPGAEATCYDENDQLLYSEDGTTYYLANASATAALEVAENSVTTVTVYSDGTNTYTSLTATADGGSTYYVTSDLAGYYVVGSTTLTAGSSVYYDGSSMYYIYSTANTYSLSTTETDAAVYSFVSATVASDAASVTKVSLTAISDGDSWLMLSSGTLIQITVTTASADNADTATSFSFSALSSNTTSSSVTDSDKVTWTFTYEEIDAYDFYSSVSAYYYSSNNLTLTYGELYYDGSTQYAVSESGSLLNGSGGEVTTGLGAGTYTGYQLGYDSNGSWVTATSSTGTVYYLASASSASIVQLTTSGETKYAYTVSGTTYYGELNESSTAYTNFVSEVDDDKTTYGADGLLTDESGYVIDTDGNLQNVEVETVYVYSVYAEAWDEDGYTGEYVTYYYYFGSSTASAYVNSDTLVDEDDASQGYYVQTGVMTTLYYDYNGNAVNSAGYIIDASTGNIVTTSETELTAGYSFTSLNGITYTVSGAATIDATTGIVYSGVSETRYYVDDNDNDVIDAGEDEVTGDGLWYVIRDDEGKIAEYQEVGNTKNVLTPEEYAELYTTTSTSA